MFESITRNLTGALSGLTRGRLSEGNIREAMGKVRQALLEADVNYDVAQAFTKRVTEQAVGETVLKSLQPAEQIVSIVYQELVNLMGPVEHSLATRRGELTIIMMCGLQGAGKTTTCGKLARMLKEQGVKPMLVAADLQRPAAIEQLRVIGEQIEVPVHWEEAGSSTPVKVCLNARKKARQEQLDVLILDTAGRLHVDDSLMQELTDIDNKLMPDQALLVCDAMTGQDAVNSAKAFNDALELDGVILTKLDGDTRGGAALSVRAVTGVPIKFAGVGEQLDALQPFHAERMAQRILGQGDVATLLETAQRVLDEDEMQRQHERMAAGKFGLDDFLKVMMQIRRMGSMKNVMKMIPGFSQHAEALEAMNSVEGMDPDKNVQQIQAMIQSMTLDERQNPDKIDRSRRNRIAEGSGTDPAEVNGLLKQFKSMAGPMQQMAGMGASDRLRKVREMGSDMLNPAGDLKREKNRSKRGPADRDALRDKKKQKKKQAKQQKKKNKKRRK